MSSYRAYSFAVEKYCEKCGHHYNIEINTRDLVNALNNIGVSEDQKKYE